VWRHVSIRLYRFRLISIRFCNQQFGLDSIRFRFFYDLHTSVDPFIHSLNSLQCVVFANIAMSQNRLQNQPKIDFDSIRFAKKSSISISDSIIVTSLVMCHVSAVLERKAAGEVKCSYVITASTVCMKWPVVYSVAKHSQLSNLGWLLRGAVESW